MRRVRVLIALLSFAALAVLSFTASYAAGPGGQPAAQGATPTPRNLPPLGPLLATPSAQDETVGGEVLVEDDFSGSGGYVGLYKDDDGESRYEQGRYIIEVTGEDNYAEGIVGEQDLGTQPQKTLSAPLNGPLAIDVDVALVNGPDNANFGVACNWQDAQNFVAFMISPDARTAMIFSTRVFSDRTPFDYYAGQQRGLPLAAIKTEPNSVNHLRAECSSQALAFYVNGYPVAQYVPQKPMDGTVALLAQTRGEAPLRVAFDNLVVTRIPDAPALSVVFREDFGDNVNVWGIGDDDANVVREITGGAYVFQVPPDKGRVYGMPIYSFANVGVQAEFTLKRGGERSFAGFSCRDLGGVGWYDAVIGWDGVYSIGKDHAGQDFVPLVDWTPSDAIQQGVGATNHVRLDCIGDTLTLYVNGQKVDQVKDTEFTFGTTRIEVGTPRDADAEIAVDNLVVGVPIGSASAVSQSSTAEPTPTLAPTRTPTRPRPTVAPTRTPTRAVTRTPTRAAATPTRAVTRTPTRAAATPTRAATRPPANVCNLAPGEAGVIIINRYNGTMRFTIGGGEWGTHDYDIPGDGKPFLIRMPPGRYTYSASIPGAGKASGQPFEYQAGQCRQITFAP